MFQFRQQSAAFSSVVRQMPGKSLQRQGTARTLLNFCVVLRIVCFVTYSVLFVCVCMCTELLPPGGYPIAAKYIISYYTISWDTAAISHCSTVDTN